MAATFRHFAINADDVQRAKRFYETLFGWKFTPYGPPNFYQIWNAGSPPNAKRQSYCITVI